MYIITFMYHMSFLTDIILDPSTAGSSPTTQSDTWGRSTNVSCDLSHSLHCQDSGKFPCSGINDSNGTRPSRPADNDGRTTVQQFATPWCTGAPNWHACKAEAKLVTSQCLPLEVSGLAGMGRAHPKAPPERMLLI